MIDLGSLDFDAHLARYLDEDLQERLRLLYVAMTRAKYAVHVYWTDRNGAPALGADACTTAAIDVLIDQTQCALRLTAGETSLDAMAAQCEGIDIVEPFGGPFARYQTSEPSQAARRAREPPSPRPFVWLHSFSSLARHATLAVDESAASDEIETEVDIEIEQAAEEDRLVADDPALTVLDAWRGRHFGNALHAILENAGPATVWPAQRPLLARHLAPLGVKPNAVGDALETVGRMVDRVRGTDLGDGFRLLDLPSQASISEFEFQFPVNGISLAALRDICVAHGIDDAVSESLTSTTLNGMLTGFADLIFTLDGKFHVLDYKTNLLGSRLEDYAEPALDAAMAEHYYALQALIYTIALHRYLRGRLDGYAPERHLGESWYLFVRAIGLGDRLGVWRRRWHADLIVALDDAFAS